MMKNLWCDLFHRRRWKELLVSPFRFGQFPYRIEVLPTQMWCPTCKREINVDTRKYMLRPDYDTEDDKNTI